MRGDPRTRVYLTTDPHVNTNYAPVCRSQAVKGRGIVWFKGDRSRQMILFPNDPPSGLIGRRKRIEKKKSPEIICHDTCHEIKTFRS